MGMSSNVLLVDICEFNPSVEDYESSLLIVNLLYYFLMGWTKRSKLETKWSNDLFYNIFNLKKSSFNVFETILRNSKQSILKSTEYPSIEEWESLEQPNFHQKGDVVELKMNPLGIEHSIYIKLNTWGSVGWTKIFYLDCFRLDWCCERL